MKALLLAFAAAFALAAAPGALSAQSGKLPTAFVLGEHEKGYDELSQAYEQSLLSACDCSMEDALKKWVSMLGEFDKYAERTGVDIRGVKVWLHAFLAADGSVEHIAYHLRPNSKQVEAAVMTDLLAGFAAEYTFPVAAQGPYSHYSVGSFPVFGELTSAAGN